MKTDAELARIELELYAIDEARAHVKYYYRPNESTWARYCEELDYAINRELKDRLYNVSNY